MTAENCPYRSNRVIQDNYRICYKDGGEHECIPNGCPYLIVKNSKLNLPNLPGDAQIDMTQEDILNIYNLYQENKSIKDTSYELKLPESDVNAVYLEIKEHEKNLRKKPLHEI